MSHQSFILQHGSICWMLIILIFHITIQEISTQSTMVWRYNNGSNSSSIGSDNYSTTLSTSIGSRQDFDSVSFNATIDKIPKCYTKMTTLVEDPQRPSSTRGDFICPAGYSSKPGISVCSICPKGTYSLEGATDCIPCPPGSFAAEEGQSACTPCKLGSYGSIAGSVVCQTCESTFYSDTEGAIVCKTCGPSEVTLDVGASSCINVRANLTIGGMALLNCIILILVYIWRNRLHWVVFERKVLVVDPLVRWYHIVQMRLDREFLTIRATIHLRRWSSVARVFLFLILSSLMVMGIMCFLYLSILYKTTFNAIFILQSLQSSEQVSISFSRVKNELIEIVKPIHLPVSVIESIFQPIFVLMNLISSFSITRDGFECEGSKAPMELLINLVVLVMVMTILMSEFLHIWHILFPNLNHSMLLNNLHVTNWVRSQSSKLLNRVLHIVSIVLLYVNPFEVFLRYIMRLVKFSQFFEMNGGHRITKACNIFCNFDTLLGVTASLVVWWLVMPLLYMIAEMMVPSCVLHDGEIIRLPHEDLLIQPQLRPPHMSNRVHLIISADANDELSGQIQSVVPPFPIARVLQTREQTGIQRGFEIMAAYRRKFFIVVEYIISIDVVIISIANYWMRFLCNRYHSISNQDVTRTSSSSSHSDDDEDDEDEESDDGSYSAEAEPVSPARSPPNSPNEREHNQTLPASSFLRTLIRRIYVELYSYRLAQHRLIRARELEDRQKFTMLSSYGQLCHLVSNELTRKRNWGKWSATLLSWLGLGHFVTRVGRIHWKFILRKYYYFGCACVGLWTDEVVDSMKLETTADQYHFSKILDLRDTYPTLFYVSIGMKSIILQIVPPLTILSIFISTLCSTPLFVKSEKLLRELPTLIIWNAWEEALDTYTVREDVTFMFTNWILYLGAFEMFITRSRLIGFIKNTIILTISLLLAFGDEQYSRQAINILLCMLLPCIFAQTMNAIIHLGWNMSIRDTDLIYTCDCCVWFITFGFYKPSLLRIQPLSTEEGQGSDGASNDSSS
jgi:hypothetical protein